MSIRIVAALGALVLLAGCAGEQGQRAQELLRQAEVAQQALRSSTFEGELSADFQGQSFSMALEGATSSDGEWVSVSAKGIPGMDDFSAQVLRRGAQAWVKLEGGWRTMPIPAGTPASGSLDVGAFQQLTRHVKAVRVTEHQVIGGKQVSVIAGSIDTEGMLEAFTKLGSLAGEERDFSLDFSKLGIELGDIEAVLTIDERTHLLDSARVTFSMAAQGQSLDLELRYRLTSANEPVELPTAR